MTPTIRHIRTAARDGDGATRREFIRNVGWAAAGCVGGGFIGSIAGQGVLDPLTEPIADPLREALYGAPTPPGPSRFLWERLADGDFERYVSGLAVFSAVIEAMQINGLRNIPESAAPRATFLEMRDGQMWVIAQGHEAAERLWKGAPQIDVPMAAQPDPAFAGWRQEHLMTAYQRQRPIIDQIRAPVMRDLKRYLALAVPARGGLFIVSADDEAIRMPVRESTAPTTHRGSA